MEFLVKIKPTHRMWILICFNDLIRVEGAKIYLDEYDEIEINIAIDEIAIDEEFNELKSIGSKITKELLIKYELQRMIEDDFKEIITEYIDDNFLENEFRFYIAADEDDDCLDLINYNWTYLYKE